MPKSKIMANARKVASAKTKHALQPDVRPFAPKHLKRARQIAEQYQILIRQEAGEYYGQALELPGVMNDGKNSAECLEKTTDILTTAVATLLEEGQVPPLPTSDDRRDEQVNIRLTKLEKLTFEEAARSRGFRGLSDFMRAATMTSVMPM